MYDDERQDGGDRDIDTTSRALGAAQQLPPDMMLLKMEGETIMSAARLRPRDPAQIVRSLQQLIDAYPAAADEAIYCKPVGSVTEVTCECGIKYQVPYVAKDTACPACGACGGATIKSTKKVQKYAEGLSIRAAESIRSVMGYTRLSTSCERLPNGEMRIQSTLVDYCAGNFTADERVVSPFFKRRDSNVMERTPEDRFLDVVVKAAKAKLRRDVILDSTPAIVKAMFRDACEKKLKDLVAPEVIEQVIIPAFAEYGVGIEDLDALAGRPHSLGWREEEKIKLRKLLNALKHEEINARELLREIRAERAAGTPQPSQAPGTVTSADLSAAVAKTVENPHEAPAPTATPEERKTERAPAETPEELQERVAGMIRRAQTADDIRLLYQQWGQRVPNREAMMEVADARLSDLESQSRAQGVSDKLRVLKERIDGYKQGARLTGLLEEIKADAGLSDEERAQAVGWVEARRRQLSGKLPLDS